jgi:hypothetical protein
MLKVVITGHPKMNNVSPNKIFSEEEEKIQIVFIYFIILQSITAS